MCKKKNGIKTQTSIKIKTLGKQSHAHLAVCPSGLLCVPGRPFLGVPASMESLQFKHGIYFFHLSDEVPDAYPLNSLTDN